MPPAAGHAAAHPQPAHKKAEAPPPPPRQQQRRLRLCHARVGSKGTGKSDPRRRSRLPPDKPTSTPPPPPGRQQTCHCRHRSARSGIAGHAAAGQRHEAVPDALLRHRRRAHLCTPVAKWPQNTSSCLARQSLLMQQRHGPGEDALVPVRTPQPQPQPQPRGLTATRVAAAMGNVASAIAAPRAAVPEEGRGGQIGRTDAELCVRPSSRT